MKSTCTTNTGLEVLSATFVMSQRAVFHNCVSLWIFLLSVFVFFFSSFLNASLQLNSKRRRSDDGDEFHGRGHFRTSVQNAQLGRQTSERSHPKRLVGDKRPQTTKILCVCLSRWRRRRCQRGEVLLLSGARRASSPHCCARHFKTGASYH